MAVSSISRFFSSFYCHSFCLTEDHGRKVVAIVAIALGCFLALAGIGMMVQGICYNFSCIAIKSFAIVERTGSFMMFFIGGSSFLGGVALACSGGKLLLEIRLPT